MHLFRTLDLPTGMSIRFGCVPPAPAKPEAADDAEKPVETATPPPRPAYPR